LRQPRRKKVEVARRLDISPTQYSVGDFRGWQRDGSLDLKPRFQRRSVWKTGAKSLFIDTLAGGLPVPLILVRDRVDLTTQRTTREVIDGQQRLRTVLSFVDPGSLPDFTPETDGFTVRKSHNRDLADKAFGSIDDDDQRAILGYKFSVQVLPSDVDEREVLKIFARINSTGTKLSPQEILNAEFFGEFKTLMYELALEQLDRWLAWKVFSPDEIARMAEVEMVSDLTVQMLKGLTGRSKLVLHRAYDENDDKFPEGPEVTRRFRFVMDEIQRLYGSQIAQNSFRQAMHFFTLFVYFYDEVFGLGNSMKRRKPKRVNAKVVGGLDRVAANFGSGKLPATVLSAVRGAATDIGSRRVRLEYVKRFGDGASG
jgi:hypothetical protein